MKKISAAKITRIALMTAFITVGAQIAFASKPPYTLQTFFIFLIAAILKPSEAVMSTLVYIALGAVGVPVFSSFSGGIGVILGVGGGFIISFPFIAGISSALLRKFKKSIFTRCFIFTLATLISYIFGALWIQALGLSDVEFGKMISSYILPFIPVDICKIALAVFCTMKLERVIKHDKNNKS